MHINKNRMRVNTVLVVAWLAIGIAKAVFTLLPDRDQYSITDMYWTPASLHVTRYVYLTHDGGEGTHRLPGSDM
jgi:hypothetical protein